MSPAGRAALAFCVAAMAAAPLCSQSAPVPISFRPELGIASWYGDAFHGRKTANGEVYDMNALTAAHKSLPFGALVIVTNLADGRRVVVRVNDRGPFVEGRIIDLSKAAAACIGLDRSGTARVDIRPAPNGASVGQYPPSRAAAESMAGETAAAKAVGYSVRIQVASFRDEANAREAIISLTRIGLRAVIERGGSYYRVAVYAQAADSARVEAILEEAGWTDRLVKAVKP